MEISNGVSCTVTESQWGKGDHIGLAIQVLVCPSTDASRTVAGILRNSGTGSDVPPVFGRDIDFTMVEASKHGTVDLKRAWAQDRRVVGLSLTCEKSTVTDCLTLLDKVTRSYSTSIPGVPLPYRPVTESATNGVFATFSLAWIGFVGIPGLVRYLRRDRYALGTGPNWVDVERFAWRLRWRSVAWGFLIACRRLCYGLLAVILLAYLTMSRTPSPVLLGILLGVTALLVVGARLASHPLNRVLPSGPAEWIKARSGWHLSAGIAMRTAARMALAALLLGVGISMYVEYTGALQSPTVARLNDPQVMSRLTSGVTAPLGYYFLLFTMFGAATLSSALVLTLIGIVALLLAVDQLGLRLLTPKVDLDRAPSGQPEVLYLRNFGDDKLRIRASRLSRRGLIGRLSPRRMRPFEQVVIRRLAFAGYVYAVNPPRAAVYGAGVPKTELPNESWLDTVEHLARRALFVVVSATPAEIHDGFAAEIEMLAERVGHDRIMLITGSWRGKKLLENWHRFLHVARQYPLFANAVPVFQTPSTHVLIHSPRSGWQAWGAASRSEWTYTAAIGLALDSVMGEWTRDRRRRLGTAATNGGSDPGRPPHTGTAHA